MLGVVQVVSVKYGNTIRLALRESLGNCTPPEPELVTEMEGKKEHTMLQMLQMLQML